MNTQHIYIDESGDLGLSENSSKVPVISAPITNNPGQLDRIVKNARRYRFNKELRKAKEIKFTKSSLELREYPIEKMNETTVCQGIHCIMGKGKLYSKYLRENRHKMYNFVAGFMASAIIPNSDNVEVRIDKPKGKYILRADFNQYFEQRLRIGSNIGKINTFHSHSENFSGIQLADILSGSVYQEFNNANSPYVDKIDLLHFFQTFLELWKSRK